MKRRKGLTEKRTKPRLTHTRANTRPLRFDLDADARIVAFVAPTHPARGRKLIGGEAQKALRDRRNDCAANL